MKRRLIAMLLCIAMICSMIVYAAGEEGEVAPLVDAAGLETHKEVIRNEDGTYTLRLEAYATGESVTTTTTTAVPTDIVLVLDQSGSMKSYCMCGRSLTGAVHLNCDDVVRWVALKNAVNAFLDTTKAAAADNKLDYRVAVVGFADYSWQDVSYDDEPDWQFNVRNSEILSFKDDDGNQDVVSVSDAEDSHYKNSLHSISTDYTILKDAVSDLDALGATKSFIGMEMAREVFAKNPLNEGENRNRIVVFFSDNAPDQTYLTGENMEERSNPDDALAIAKELKDQGVKIYTIGVFNAANPDDMNDVGNKFMNLLSSKYPDADSMDNAGAGNEKNYYLSAKDSNKLKEVFNSISTDITTGGSDIELGEEAVLKDVITEQFVLTGGNDAIKVYTAACTGKDGDTFTFADEQPSELKATTDGNTISVTGFDYGKNWVGENKGNTQNPYHGSKLILEIPIAVRDGFLGGNGVYTNTEASAIYSGTEIVEQFNRPTVDIDMPELTVSAQDFVVDSGSDIAKSELRSNVTVRVNGKTWDSFDPWQKAYLSAPTFGTNPESYSNVTENQTYTATATLKDLSGNVIATATDTGNITVRKSTGGLETNKTATFDPTSGTGVLTLEAWATGERITTTVENPVPNDIILILDQSGSMNEKYGSTTRIAALKVAANAFVNNVIDDAMGMDQTFGTDDDVDHRIAVIGFGSFDIGDLDGNTNNTKLLSLDPAIPYTEGPGKGIPNAKYKESLQNVTIKASRDIVTQAVESVSPKGNTDAYVAFLMAQQVFKNNPATDRNRIVVFFTDGEPTISGNSSGENPFQKAVANAIPLKKPVSNNGYGATIYSIGILDNANASDMSSNANKFMNVVSSNFPDASAWNNIGDRKDSKYYLPATGAENLTDIFTTISQEIATGGSAITLGTDTVLKDVLTEQFVIDSANSDGIKVYTAEVDENTGEFKNREPINLDPTISDVEVDGKREVSVSVSGFNYSENWVGAVKNGSSTTYRGQKLIVEIPFKVREGFLGGNGVYTNTEDSAIYSGEEVIEEFHRPQVDVSLLDLSVDAQDFEVDYNSNVDLGMLQSHVTVSVLGKSWGELESWQKAYVNEPSLTITPNSFTGLTANTTYTANAILAPKTGAGQAVAEDTANIIVRKSVGSLETEKKVKGFDQETGKGTLRLEAWATGELITTTIDVVTLGSEAVLKDVIAQQFKLPDNVKASDIKVYTANYTGENTFSSEEVSLSGAEINIDGKTVSVSGFDYSANWVGIHNNNGKQEYRGQKLIVEIPFEVADGFMGGYNIETNDIGSGVFDDDEIVEPFDSPTVDVYPKELVFNDCELNVYLKNGLTKEQIVEAAGINTAIGNLADWQKEHVTFEATIVNSNGVEVTNFSNLTGDQIYTVKVTTKLKGEGETLKAEATQTATVNVFKPTITFKDSAVDYLATPDYQTQNFEGVVWKHGETEATSVTMTGTEPTLDYSFNPAAAQISDDTNVKVSVLIGTENIDQYVTFYRNACTGNAWSCEFEGGLVDNTDANRVNFVVHLKTFDLKITKALGANTTVDAGERFLINIVGGNVNLTVVIGAGETVTIKNIPVGEYTITENGASAWRYTVSVSEIINGEVSITNTQNPDKTQWLDGYSYVENSFKGVRNATNG